MAFHFEKPEGFTFKPGQAIDLILPQPFGSLTLHKKLDRPAVFIAGGIGITPFMSMLRHAANGALRQQLLLLYSNRRPEDCAFLTELQRLEGDHGDFRQRGVLRVLKTRVLRRSCG